MNDVSRETSGKYTQRNVSRETLKNFWEELMAIQRLENKVQENFNRTETLYDIEKKIKNGVQEKFFSGQLIGGNT